MAQVVRQRATTPYLLITISILMVICLGVAVFYYLQYDKKKQEAAVIPDLKKAHADALKTSKDETKELAGYIVPDATFLKAKTKFTDFDITHDTFLGLIGEMKKLKTDEKDLKAELANVKERTAGESSALNAKITQLKATIEAKDNANRLLIAKAEAEAKKLAEREATHDAETAKVDKNHKELLAQRDAEKIKLADANVKATATITMKDNKIAYQADRIRILEAEIANKGAFVSSLGTKKDGKITKVLPEENICYINIGSNDGVNPYATFEIYEFGSKIPETGQGKGKLVVSSVYKSICECKIVAHDKNNPVRIGDIIANIAFDKTKTYTFMVSGAFDLRGGDNPTPQAQDEVKAMIKKSGGKITQVLGVDTDFLVLGIQPPVPPKPEAHADLQTREAYNEALRKLQDFNKLLGQANSLHVKILNTNSFLDFMGR